MARYLKKKKAFLYTNNRECNGINISFIIATETIIVQLHHIRIKKMFKPYIRTLH